MAIFNEILSGRYNRALQKIFAVKGGPPVRQIGGEIMPIVSIFSGAENRFAEGWYRYGFAVANAAIAGLTTAARFRNPTGSNSIAVIESCKLWTAAAMAMDIRQRANLAADADLGTPSQPFSLELRTRTGLQNQMSTSMHISTDLAGNQQGTQIWFLQMPAGGTPLELINCEDQEWVIDPGQWVQIFSNLANTAWVVNFTWRERPLEESERQ